MQGRRESRGKTLLCWCAIAGSVFCHYTVGVCARMLYAGDHVSSCPVLVIWVCMIQNNPGLQAPMVFVSALEGVVVSCMNIIFTTYWLPEHVNSSDHMIILLSIYIAIANFAVLGCSCCPGNQLPTPTCHTQPHASTYNCLSNNDPW